MNPSNGPQLSFWDLDPGVEQSQWSSPEPGTAVSAPQEPKEPVPGSAAHSELAATFARVFKRLNIKRPPPIFEASYHPFAGLRSTVRLRHGKALVRVSDVLKEAPPLVIEAIAEILLGQVYRVRPSREARDCYKAYIMGPEMRQSIEEVRRVRGFKLLLPPKGRYFDLAAIFDELNARFFNGELTMVRIGWSPNRSRTLLGHYDSAHSTITISRRFDATLVPRYAVDYLVYHEMLHVLFPVERNGHRRVVHTRSFLQAEKKFPMYEEARKWLKRVSGHFEGM